MKAKRKILYPESLYLILFGILSVGIGKGVGSVEQTTLSYFGRKPPGLIPGCFAPGIVSLDSRSEIGPSFSEDGKKLYFRVKKTLFVSELKGEMWSDPVETSLPGKIEAGLLPTISADGCTYTVCRNGDVYLGKKEGDSFQEAEIMKPVSSEAYECGVSIASNGNAYFGSQREGTKGHCDIFFSEYRNGIYLPPVNIEILNTHLSECKAFVAPDESYLIFTSVGREDGYGSTDMYISFRGENNHWSSPVNMGKDFNGEYAEEPVTLSPDGKYFFFLKASKRGDNLQFDIYWVDSSALLQLRSGIDQ